MESIASGWDGTHASEIGSTAGGSTTITVSSVYELSSTAPKSQREKIVRRLYDLQQKEMP